LVSQVSPIYPIEQGMENLGGVRLWVHDEGERQQS
jgi:hypothetical protein